MNKEINLRKKIGVSVLTTVIVMSMLIVPVDMWWHGGQSPNWLPFRYSFLLSFFMLSAAAEAFAKRTGTDRKHFIVSIITVLILDTVVFAIGFEQLAGRSGWIAADISVIYLILYFFLLYPGEGRKKEWEKDSAKQLKWKNIKQLAAVLALLAVSTAELIWNAQDTINKGSSHSSQGIHASYRKCVH